MCSSMECIGDSITLPNVCTKADIDVIKIEEDGGNHLEATEGDMEAWEQMVQTAKQAEYDDIFYYQLQG